MGTIRRLLDTLDRVVLYGAGKDLRKPKTTGRKAFDFLAQLSYYALCLLDRLDTLVLFDKRTVKTNQGRVRSRPERKIALFLENQGIEYVYEAKLSLEGVELHPDFYLPQHQVYVEFWGLVNENWQYRRVMRRKMYLYKKHGIAIISLYPRHLENLGMVFYKLLEKAKKPNG